MIIANSSQISIDQFLKHAIPVIYGAIILTILGMGFSFVYYIQKESHRADPIVISSKTVKKYDLASIGSGALSLNSTVGPLSFLSNEVRVIARNSRPNVKGDQAQLLLSLKSSGEEKIVNNGEKIFLDDNEGLIRFSKGQSNLSITPFIIDRCSTVFEVEGGGQFILEECSQVKGDPLLCFQVLNEAKWWGPDLLIQNYGGAEYRQWRDKQKIEFFHPIPYALFVTAGDFLLFENDRWKVVPQSEVKSNRPLAVVRSMGRGLEIEAWDATGFRSVEYKYNQQHPQPIAHKMDNLPTAFRMRTSTQVTCLFGKKRVILKKGDWLLKTATGWHILKKWDEIEDCLQHRVKGELFIFDELEKDEGKVSLKGHLYDEMRVQVQQVAIPIIKEKKTGMTRRKKKHVLSKRDFVLSPSRTKSEGLR